MITNKSAYTRKVADLAASTIHLNMPWHSLEPDVENHQSHQAFPPFDHMFTFV
jgi:hypothetical protein